VVIIITAVISIIVARAAIPWVFRAVVSGADPAIIPAVGVVPVLLAVVISVRFRAVVPGTILSTLIILRGFLDALRTTAGAATAGGDAARCRAEQGHHR
jgi:hypothetical protein